MVIASRLVYYKEALMVPDVDVILESFNKLILDILSMPMRMTLLALSTTIRKIYSFYMLKFVLLSQCLCKDIICDS